MDDSSSHNSSSITTIREHLANERTFLAWIRTCLGIMAFGFVVVKFSLFLKQITAFLGGTKSFSTTVPAHPIQGYSAYLGIILVALGAIISAFAFMKFKTIANQIETNSYERTIWLDSMLALTVILIAIFLIVYLFISV